MQLVQLFTENFNAIGQYIAENRYKKDSTFADNLFLFADLILVNKSHRRKKKFLHECVEELQQCKTINDFRVTKLKHFKEAKGFSLLQKSNPYHYPFAFYREIRHLQKYVYFSVFECLFLYDNDSKFQAA